MHGAPGVAIESGSSASTAVSLLIQTRVLFTALTGFSGKFTAGDKCQPSGRYRYVERGMVILIQARV